MPAVLPRISSSPWLNEVVHGSVWWNMWSPRVVQSSGVPLFLLCTSLCAALGSGGQLFGRVHGRVSCAALPFLLLLNACDLPLTIWEVL